ncbi:MAG: hydrogenase maturation factor [Lachnospiraceae bacterium]|nr:hydrogenase maturation factor [Lachnospiraceae bacterium]
MKKGKISQNVLKRSVLKYIQKENTEMLKGAGIGEDCAFLTDEDTMTAVSTQTVALPVSDAAKCAVHAAVNNLAAGGAKAHSITVSLTLPVECEEQELQRIMKQTADTCKELSLQIAGGHTEVSDYVKTPVITVTALGKPFSKAVDGDKTNLDIVMTKWIGLEGTIILAKEKEEELLTRYPIPIVKAAQGFDTYLSLIPEAATAMMSGVYTMHDMRSGGVFGALYELAKRMGVGLTVDLKQIPVKQETIEICEFFDLNPYELLSGGSLLIVTANGDKLVEELLEANIFAAVIGKTTDNNDKVVLNEEETRFLEPAKADEIYKVNFESA